MLIQVNFDPIQEIGPRRLVLFCKTMVATCIFVDWEQNIKQKWKYMYRPKKVFAAYKRLVVNYLLMVDGLNSSLTVWE